MAKFLAALIVVAPVLLVHAAQQQQQIVNITLMDKTRSRPITATICMRDADHQDLYVFAHGGGLYAGDYEYLCGAEFPGVSARLVSAASDDPMDLMLMTKDVLFLSSELPDQSRNNATSPLYGRLTTQVVLAGHSMGGAAVLLAAAEASKDVKAVVAIAPGFWGPQQSELLQRIHAKGMHSQLCALPYLQLAGDQDCANSLSLQALSIWRNVTSSCVSPTPRSLAVLKGATHCQWATPVVGSCPFDEPCPAPRLERIKQQQLGVSLLAALGQGQMKEKLHEASRAHQLAFVDETSKEDDLAKLKSWCPCNNVFV